MTHAHPPRSIADLRPGDHLCCLYETEEECWPALTTFLRQGLERNEQILYITDTRPADAILECLQDNGLDAAAYLDGGQMIIISGDDVYLQGDAFDPERLIDLMKTRIEQALADGYRALCIVGEMSWMLWGMPGSERWAEYEAALDELLLGGQCLSLCQYDRRLFGAGALLDVLRIHPLVIIGAEVYENLYYTPIADLQDRSQSAVALQRRIENVIAHQRAEEALRSARDELEVRVQERTAELAQANEELQTEVVEREQAERTLRRRAAQLALLSDIGGKIAAISDLEGVLERAARLVQESFGYHHVGLFTLDREQGELVMRAKAGDFVGLYPPDHRLKLDQGMVGWVGRSCHSLLANDVDAESHYVNLYPDVVPTRSELCVPILAGGEVVGVLDIQSPQLDAFDENDVTALETLASQIAVAIEGARLYEALRVSEERYRAVSRLAADFAYAIRVDPDGSIAFEWVTAAFARLTGYTEDEVEGRDGWKRVIYPDDLPTVLAHLEERLSGQPNEAEYRILTKGGQIRWWRDYGRPEWDESQERVVRIYGAAQDVTERRRMEEYVLHTERLAAMGHMAATLTHEIESPLRLIQEHLSLALEPDVEPVEHEEHLRLCQQEIEHLTEIAEQVLGLAQPAEDAAWPASIDDLV